MIKNTTVIELDGSVGPSERVPRNLGFLLCDPPYNKHGALPREGEHNGTKVDIIGVAAVGADAKNSWVNNRRFTKGTDFETTTQAPDSDLWITRNIRKDIPEARVLLYEGHAIPQEGENLRAFAIKFLKSLHDLRSHDVYQSYLALADVFEATPHQGSSYLSDPEFASSITRAMRLQNPLPRSLQYDLRVSSKLLQHMASDFKRLAADLVVWTFYETEDTDLTMPMTAERPEIPILAPIASIKSAILDFYHELDLPLWTDHMGCASFSGDNSEARQDFLLDLKKAVNQAIRLSSEKHSELNIKAKVEVEVHGFYKGIPLPAGLESPIRLWSIRKKFQDFLRLGPSKCLEERLSEASPPPRVSQLLQSASARAPSLDSRVTSSTPLVPSGLASNNLTRKEGEVSSTAIEQGQLFGPSEDEETLPSLGTRKAAKHRIVEFLTPNENASKTTGSSSRSSRRASLQEHKTPFLLRPLQRQAEAIQKTTTDVPPPNLTVSDPVNIGSHDMPDVELQERPLPNAAGLQPSAALRSDVLHNSNLEHFAAVQSRPKQSAPIIRANERLGVKPLLSPKITNRMSIPETAEEPHEQNGEPLFSSLAFKSRFVKPDVADRKLTWIHVPFNNPSWVSASSESSNISIVTNDHRMYSQQ
ncbi:hypothetical protein MMC27_007159 [Xylographa pallens]|nr:hypothetical protein [Xylographa pallens]